MVQTQAAFDLKKIFSALTIDPQDPRDLSCCYAIVSNVLKHISASALTPSTVDAFFRNTSFASFLHTYKLDSCITAESAIAHAHEFYNLIAKLIQLRLVKDYKTIFSTLCPNYIARWDVLESQFSSISSLMCALFLILNDTAALKGTEDIFVVNPFECFHNKEAIFTKIGVDADAFLDLWGAVLYTPLFNCKSTINARIGSAMNAYKALNVPYQKLLNDFYLAQKHCSDLNIAINAWEHLPENVTSATERGMTAEETLFNSAVWSIRHLKATDLVQALFYKKRDDSAIECSFILNEFLLESRNSSNILIVNPSPTFLNEYATRMSSRQCAVTFAVADDIVKNIYALQFPSYNFCTISSLESCSLRYDFLLLFARDYDPVSISNAYSLCDSNARIIAFLPQKFIASKQHKFPIFPCGSLSVDKIIDIPNATTKSSGRRKMLLYAFNTPNQATPYFQLLFGACDKNKTHFYIQATRYQIPAMWLERKLWLSQMRKDYLDAQNARVVNHYGTSKEYIFFPEIIIRYNLLPNRKNRISAEAYYHAILRPHEQNRKRGNKLVSPTEKGLRAINHDDLMRRLESVALRDEFSSAIVPDIVDFYRQCPEELSLKTIWFCCRTYLLSTMSYNEQIVLKMFCSSSQHLAHLIPSTAIFDDYYCALLDIVAPEENITSKYWMQLNLILNAALKFGFISENPLAAQSSTIAELHRKELRTIRNALTKNSFSSTEESKMFAFLFERNALTGAMRCVYESKWLIGLIRLTTGMPIREVCALTWSHLRKNDQTGIFQFYILQYLNADNQVLSLAVNQNRRKYRKIPLAPLLSQVLQARLNYLITNLGYSIEELAQQPIVLAKEPIAKSAKKHKHQFCSRKKAVEVSNVLLQKAEIPPKIITLLEGSQSFENDLNTTSGDIFHTNFQHKAAFTCRMMGGMISYISGTKHFSTFDDTYCDHANEHTQEMMATELHKWLCRYMPESNFPGSEYSNVTIAGANYQTEINCSPSGIPAANIELSLAVPTSNEPFTIELRCPHNIAGTTICFTMEDQ